MFYWFIKLIYWPVARLYFRMRVRGSENIPKKGPVLIAANHASILDPPSVGSASPRKIHFIIKKKIYDKFMQQWFYKWMETIPVKESQAADLDAIKSAIKVLDEGGIVGIFPQGRITDDESELAWLNGAAFIAAKTGCLTVPCAIIGTERALPLENRFPRPFRIQVVFGRPLRFQNTGNGKVRKEEVVLFTNRVFREIMELRGN